MTDAKYDPLKTYAAYVGPVIEASLTLVSVMKPVPLCVACLAARWYRYEDDKGAERLDCFCTTFRGTMYDHRNRAVTSCDAHTDAVDRETTA